MYKQFIAYILATRLNGKIEIPTESFCPISNNFIYEYSYDEVSGKMILSGRRHTIEISSRYGRNCEIKEMEDFVAVVEDRSLAPYVRSLFYDSKSNCCSFEFTHNLKPHSFIASELLAAARETIGQFDWFDSVEHGSPLLDMPEELDTQ